MNENGFLRAYLHDIRQFPLLSAAEESELSKRVRAGDSEALHKLIESNLRFVVKIAEKYRSFGVSLMDLVGEGNIGLIEAAKRFDFSKRCRFTTYAIWWIKHSILTAIAKQGRAFPLSSKMVRILRLAYRIAGSTDTLPRDRQSTATELNVGLQELENTLTAAANPISLDGFEKQGQNALPVRIEQTTYDSPQTEATRKNLNQELQRSLEILTPIQKMILRDRFGLDGGQTLTLQQIGNRLALTRERIRQIEASALKKLRTSPRAANLAAFSFEN